MKYSLNELERASATQTPLQGVIDYSSKVNDIMVKIDPAEVSGYVTYQKALDQFDFRLHIKTNLVILNAISLKETNIRVDFQTDLFYTFKVIDDDSFPIIGNEINLDEEIWGEIFLQLPYRVVEDGEEFTQEDFYKGDSNTPFKDLL